MNNHLTRVLLVSLIVCSSVASFSQERSGEIPHIIRFNGTLTNVDGSPRTGTVGVAFSIYADEKTTVPLWQEVQSVTTDASGHYTVLLGATRAEGLPDTLFAGNTARWLGIRVENDQEQPRVLLAAVPYALKAADAETLGGRPLSAFVLSETAASGANATSGGGTTTSAQTRTLLPALNTGSTGTQNFVAKWTDSAGTLGNSIMFDNGALVGVGTTNPSYRLQVATDGTGGQLGLTGATTNNKQMFMGYDTSNNFGFIQVTYQGVSFEPLVLERDGGSVGIGKTPSLAVFDVNGGGAFSGNVSAAGSVTAALFSGSGASLTSLPAGNLTGGIPNAALTSTSIPAGNLIGTVPSPAISGTYSNAVTFANASNNYTGNGSNLSNVAAASVGSVPAATENLRLITYLGGCDSCSVLTTSDNQNLIYQNLFGVPLAFVSITCYSDVGAPNINIQRDTGSSTANVTPSAISCSTSGNTVNSFSVATMNANDKLNFLMTAPDALAHRVTVIIKATL